MQPEPRPPIDNLDEPQPLHQPDTLQQQRPEVTPVPTTTSEQPPQAATPIQQPAYTPQQPAPAQRPVEDPGKLFSILGLIFAFIFLQLPGLILSIIGLNKSKKAGYPTTLAIIGICLNAVTMIATIGILAAISLVAFQGVQSRSADTALQSRAESIIKKAEVYSVESGTYPSIEQLRAQDTESHADQTTLETATLADTNQPSGDEIGYIACTDSTSTITGAEVYVYLQTDQRITHVGTAGLCGTITE